MCLCITHDKCDLQATTEEIYWVQCDKCEKWRTLPQPQVSTYA